MGRGRRVGGVLIGGDTVGRGLIDTSVSTSSSSSGERVGIVGLLVVGCPLTGGLVCGRGAGLSVGCGLVLIGGDIVGRGLVVLWVTSSSKSGAIVGFPFTGGVTTGRGLKVGEIGVGRGLPLTGGPIVGLCWGCSGPKVGCGRGRNGGGGTLSLGGVGASVGRLSSSSGSLSVGTGLCVGFDGTLGVGLCGLNVGTGVGLGLGLKGSVVSTDSVTSSSIGLSVELMRGCGRKGSEGLCGGRLVSDSGNSSDFSMSSIGGRV